MTEQPPQRPATPRQALERVVEALAELESSLDGCGTDVALPRRLVDRAGAAVAQLEVELPPDTAAIVGASAAFDHVGIAVSDLAAAARTYALLGGRLISGGDNDDMGLRTVQYAFRSGVVELLADLGGGRLQDFIQRHGEGVHHLTFLVEDVAAEAQRLVGEGVDVRGLALDSPEWKECYVMPAQAGGVLVQLVETPLGAQERRADVALDEVLRGEWGWQAARPTPRSRPERESS